MINGVNGMNPDALEMNGRLKTSLGRRGDTGGSVLRQDVPELRSSQAVINMIQVSLSSKNSYPKP
jgi:hypothetical protein